jgi:hypothetical protein
MIAIAALLEEYAAQLPPAPCARCAAMEGALRKLETFARSIHWTAYGPWDWYAKRSTVGELYALINDLDAIAPATPAPEGTREVDAFDGSAAAVNALPEPLRRYIHDLATRCDPAGDVRTIFAQRLEIEALRARCAAVGRAVASIPVPPSGSWYIEGRVYGCTGRAGNHRECGCIKFVVDRRSDPDRPDGVPSYENDEANGCVKAIIDGVHTVRAALAPAPGGTT